MSLLIRHAALLFIVWALASPSRGWTQGLSSPHKVRWALSETDCQLARQYWHVGEALDVFHSAPSSERIHFKATGWGTKILVSQPIDPAYIIPELKPRLWVRATRPGGQMFVRAVLPRTVNPDDRKPLTALLPGPMLMASNQWEKLDYADLGSNMSDLLEEAVLKLQSTQQKTLDASGAYIDMIVLNLFSGPGTNTVWTDDLNIAGAVLADAVAAEPTTPILDSQVVGTGFEQAVDHGQIAAKKRPALSRTNASVLEVRQQPFFARVIECNGEPFEFLKELGFNVIELATTATPQQLNQARRLDLWIVCPPPNAAIADSIGPLFDSVVAWSVGPVEATDDLKTLASLKSEVRQRDSLHDRPIVLRSGYDAKESDGVCDILTLGFETLGGSFALHQYSDWLEQRTSLIDRSLPVWAVMQTETLASVEQQAAMTAGLLPPMPIEPLQLKFMAFECIASGARGLRFVSRSRLDASDPVSRLRSTTLRWLNAQLSLLQPWVSGAAVTDRQTVSGESAHVTTMSTPRSRLHLIQRVTHREQWVTGDLEYSDFALEDGQLSPSDQPYLLTENGLIPLADSRTASRNEIKVEKCGPLAAVVVTQDPLVINRLAESYTWAGDRSQTEMHLELSLQWLALAQLVNQQIVRAGQTAPVASGLVNEANNLLRQAQSLISSGSEITGNRFLSEADQKLAASRSAILEDARSRFASSTSSPLLSHVSLVPLHFELATRLGQSQWQANILPGGDFEDLDHMVANGWGNHISGDQNVRTQVELSDEKVVDGRRSLAIRVLSKEGLVRPQPLGRAPLWIDSSELKISRGQLVRIHGWVNIPRPIAGSHDGLMITDSIGGPDLCERIRVTRGWEEFTMYRGSGDAESIRIRFSLTGIGEAYLDEVTVQTVELPRLDARQAGLPESAPASSDRK